LDEIVQLCTEPRFRGKMVVILAGYDHQINELMAVNPGLKSRFRYGELHCNIVVIHISDVYVAKNCIMNQYCCNAC